jgi:antitoxin CptB
MSGSTRTSDGLDVRRSRLLFRSWHRGIREMDLIMGRFADAHIGALSENELAEFESLLELPDPQLLAWITGAEAAPPDCDNATFRRIRDFHLKANP